MIHPRFQYVASADGTQIAYTTIGEGPASGHTSERERRVPGAVSDVRAPVENRRGT